MPLELGVNTLNIRQIILKRMAEMNLSAHALAKKCPTVKARSLQYYVRGDHDLGGDKLAEVMAALELKVS